MDNLWFQLYLVQEKRYEDLKKDTRLILADKETARLIAHRCLHQEPIYATIYISEDNAIGASFILERTDFYIKHYIANQDNLDAKRINYIYNQFRKQKSGANHGYLEYKLALQVELYNLLLKNPSFKVLVDWFFKNVPSIKTVNDALVW